MLYLSKTNVHVGILKVPWTKHDASRQSSLQVLQHTLLLSCLNTSCFSPVNSTMHWHREPSRGILWTFRFFWPFTDATQAISIMVWKHHVRPECRRPGFESWRFSPFCLFFALRHYSLTRNFLNLRHFRAFLFGVWELYHLQASFGRGHRQ